MHVEEEYYYVVYNLFGTLPETPETNQRAPENGWLEDFLVSFWGPAHFRWQAFRFKEFLVDVGHLEVEGIPAPVM